jgi:hypothetical protein
LAPAISAWKSAAVARQLGLDVTVVETAVRPLARVTSPEVAGFFLDEHTRQGVRFVLGGQPALIKGSGSRDGVGLTDGTELPADIVIAGIGVTPEIDAGAAMRTHDRKRHRHRRTVPHLRPEHLRHRRLRGAPDGSLTRRLCRLESVHNAVEGAKIVAATIQAANYLRWKRHGSGRTNTTSNCRSPAYSKVMITSCSVASWLTAPSRRSTTRAKADRSGCGEPAGGVSGSQDADPNGAHTSAEVIADETRPMKELVAAREG